MPLCLGLALCASSCGLEDYPYLYPASGVSQQSGTGLDFSHNTANQGSSFFLGYEVYYRIYDGTSSSVSSTASSDGSAIESSWDSVTPDVILARLKAKGYLRLVHLDGSGSSVSAPFAHVSTTASSAYVSFNLTQSGTSSITIDGTTTSFTVRRNAYDDAKGEYRNFGDFTKSDDCNYSTTSATNPSVAYVRAYVFAYGLDSSLNTIVSRPSLLTYGAVPLTKSSSE